MAGILTLNNMSATEFIPSSPEIDPTVKSLLSDLFEHASAEQRQDIEDQLAAAREFSGHLVTEVHVNPDGTMQLKAHMPKEGEAPGFRVVRTEPAQLEDMLPSYQTVGEYAEMMTRPVPEELYQRNRIIREDARLLASGLGGGDLAKATGKALAKRADDIVEVARKVNAGQESSMTLEEVAIAQRDLFFLEQAVIQALGERDFQTGIEISNTIVESLEYKKMAGNGYSFTYAASTVTTQYEGDHPEPEEGDVHRGVDFRWLEGTPYRGRLEVSIDPDRRISFSYIPEQEVSRVRYDTSHVAERDNKLVHHAFRELNMRLDVDAKSPAGVALDLGRSAFESDTFLRDGDLLGRVMELADPVNGSHTYDGFTSEMLPQLRDIAERLIVQLTLGMNEHDIARTTRRKRLTDLGYTATQI